MKNRSKSLIVGALFVAVSAAFLSVVSGCSGAKYSRSAIPGDLNTLCLLSDAESRSISPENLTGERGGGAKEVPDEDSKSYRLGKGWKVRPCVTIKPGKTFELMNTEGPGLIQNMWITMAGDGSLERRCYILRMYWDDEKEPSVECPLGDFFCNAYKKWAPLSSQVVCVGPRQAFSCFWPMPFRKRARITLEHCGKEPIALFYQINYALGEVPDDAAYFHAQFRRSNPTKGSLHTILDGVKGRGHYAGTYFAWRCRNYIWWGEGEIKFYMDGDTEYPTICGTGAEDYVLGSHNFEVLNEKKFWIYNTPYAGLIQAEEAKEPDSVSSYGMYRWHVTDPVRFNNDLRVTIQDLGWAPGPYVTQNSDISTTAFWYQTEPHASFPKLPSIKELEEDYGNELVSRKNSIKAKGAK